MALNILSLSKGDGVPGLAACVRLTLVGWLAPDLLQAAAQRFPWNEGIDLRQGVILGIQAGVAFLDIEKDHLRHLQFLWLSVTW